MILHNLYRSFCERFPWFVPHILKYQGNRKEGGIDIWLDTGEIMNYQETRKTWCLKKLDWNTIAS